MRLRHLLMAGVVAALLAPAAAIADPVEINPFGTLQMQVLAQPSGTDPGRARLTIVTATGGAFSGGPRIFFGLRIMGSEDMEMTGFGLTGNPAGCTVSDFAGSNTAGGWQGATLFGAGAPGVGSANGHMRMIGGFIRQSCGNIQIDVTFRARPLVAFYGAFFGYEAAPWHDAYGEAPWSVVPTGGDASYQEWWNLWGTFDTLGYSNACVNVTGTDVTCG